MKYIKIYTNRFKVYMKFKYYFIVLISIVLNQACQTTENLENIAPGSSLIPNSTSTLSSSVIDDYVDLQLKLIANTPGYSAPVAARSMAYITLAGYEAAVHGIDGKATMAGKLQGLNNLPLPVNGAEYHWGLVVNTAQYTLMRHLYATTGDVFKAEIDELRKSYDSKFKQNIGFDTADRSVSFGVAIGQAIWDYAKLDGGNDAWNNNFPQNNSEFSGIGRWEPTGSQRRPLLPQWTTVRSFLVSNSSIVSDNAPVFSFKNDTEFFNEARKVYNESSNLNDDQKAVMNFWIDPTGTFTTAGHHMANIRTIVKKQAYGLDKAAVLYLKAGLALHDSYVNSWKQKYSKNIMRPETYIRQTIDPTWKANGEASPTPEYTSEEATAAAAIGLILTNELGNDYTFEDTAKFPKRTYNSFDTYVKEATSAHFYAGTHYQISLDNSVSQGQRIATNLIQL
jgi:hypothetical protein